MIKTKNRKKPYQINYETEWKHNYLEPQNYLYFPANTPIEEITFKLENSLNRLFPDLNANYQGPGAIFSFSRLYRNIISDYKGWQVSYRKPGFSKNYHAISEKIGYKPRNPKRSLKQTVLKNKMRWTHELYPLIGRVEIKGVDSCETIAHRLNSKMSNPGYKSFLNRFQPDLDNLSKNYRALSKKKADFDCKNDHVCQMFCENFQNIYNYYEQMRLLMTKDYLVHGFNINDALQKDSQKAKGWRVEFIE